METGVLSATKEGHSFSGFALLISLEEGVGFEPMPPGCGIRPPFGRPDGVE